MARYIASTKSKVIAKGSKVQYTNFTVSTDTLTNGIISCPRLDFDEITYKKVCCNPRQIHNNNNISPISNASILDGGDAFYNYILNSKHVVYTCDGGGPSSVNPTIINCGSI